MAVDERYWGLWERLSLADANGVDRTTRVCWLQVGDFYGDVRVPWPRPVFTGRRLEEYNDAQLRWLLGQQGFAGRLEVTGDRFRWHRALDYQPDATVIDAGRMTFLGDRVIEEGLHAPYREEWRHTAPVGAEPLVLELVAVQGAPARPALLLAVGDWFIYGCARTPPLPQAASLAHLAATAQPLHALADCEISFGLRRGPAAWRIALSTLPFREGQPLFADGEWPGPPQGDESTQRIRGIMRRWRVHAWSAGFPPTRSV